MLANEQQQLTYWRHTYFEGDTAPWTLQYEQGRGFIAKASRSFVTGEFICRERPIFWVLSHEPSIESIREEIELIDEGDQHAFYALSNTCPGDVPRELGIFRTNAFDMAGCSMSSEASGLYCAIARLNHSCVPNVQQTHYAVSGEEWLHAARDIAAGEELNDCYVNLLQDRAARQQELQGLYGFMCGCDGCVLPPDAQVIDDRRRRQAVALEGSVFAAVDEGDISRAIELNAALIRLLESPDTRHWVERYRAEARLSAYQLHSALEWHDQAAIHIARAVQWNTLYEGALSPQSVRLRVILEHSGTT